VHLCFRNATRAVQGGTGIRRGTLLLYPYRESAVLPILAKTYRCGPERFMERSRVEHRQACVLSSCCTEFPGYERLLPLNVWLQVHLDRFSQLPAETLVLAVHKRWKKVWKDISNLLENGAACYCLIKQMSFSAREKEGYCSK